MSRHSRNIRLILALIVLSTISDFLHGQDLGYATIETDSIGIEILVNGKLIGATPLPPIALQPGTHEIAALHPQRFLWGNLDWVQTIHITSGDTAVLKPTFRILLSIQSEPFGAEVLLNNELQGTTPLTIVIDPKDSYSLILKKEGYNDYFSAGNQFYSSHLNVQLSKNDQFFDTNQEKQQRQQHQRRYRKITYSLWGLSILTGLATVYFKDQADEKYQQYLVSGSLQEMNKLFNEANRYDRYSNISLGAVQGCFVLSFYFLIKSVN